MRWLFYVLLTIASVTIVSVLFNLFQIIVILTGDYNRPANIEPPIFATFVAILPTLMWLIISISVLFMTIRRIR